MWWVGKPLARVYLSRHAIVFGGVSVGEQAETGVESVDVGQPGEVTAALTAWGKTLPRRTRVEVSLSGGLARPFLVPAAADLRNERERQLAAEALARKVYGAHEPLHVWLEPSPQESSSRLAVACPKAWLEVVIQGLGGASGRLAAITPWWSSALRAELKADGALQALGVMESDAITVLGGGASEFRLVDSIEGKFDGEAGRACFDRALMDLDVGDGGADAGGSGAIRLIRLDWTSKGMDQQVARAHVDTEVPFAGRIERLE